MSGFKEFIQYHRELGWTDEEINRLLKGVKTILEKEAPPE